VSELSSIVRIVERYSPFKVAAMIFFSELVAELTNTFPEIQSMAKPSGRSIPEDRSHHHK
jgi:hypothetical protein